MLLRESYTINKLTIGHVADGLRRRAVVLGGVAKNTDAAIRVDDEPLIEILIASLRGDDVARLHAEALFKYLLHRVPLLYFDAAHFLLCLSDLTLSVCQSHFNTFYVFVSFHNFF